MSYEATIHLFQAIKNKDLDQVKYAVANADIDGRNPHECNVTPLYYAARMKTYDVVDFLLSEKAAPDALSSTMQHNFTFAFAMDGSSDAIDHLISLHKKHQFKLTGEDKFKNDLIDASISRSSEKLFSYLLKQNIAKMNHTDVCGENYLHAALRSESGFFVQALLAHDEADKLLAENSAGSAFHLCAEKHPQHLPHFIASDKIDLERKDLAGDTALLTAIKAGNLTSVTTLLEAGANPNATNSAGDTALILTAQFNFTASAEQLLNHGANIDAISAAQKSALFTAKEAGHDKIVSLLKNHIKTTKQDHVQNIQDIMRNSCTHKQPLKWRRRPKP